MYFILIIREKMISHVKSSEIRREEAVLELRA